MPSSAGIEAGAAMELTVSKANLLKELTATQGVVERKTTIPILANFLFEATGDKLSITATDLDLSLRTACPAKVKKDGSCTIPARKLHDYVKLLGDGDITIKLLENHWVQIRSGRSNTKMVGMARANFPALPPFPSESAIKLPSRVVRNLIAKTIFSISNEESRYTLNGALMVLKPESIIMVATDGHRLAHIEHNNSKPSVSGELKVLVPKKAMAELFSLLGDIETEEVEFARDESTLFFRIGARLLTSRQLTGQFPNYEAVLPRDNNKSLTVHCDELSGAIQRVAQFADERSNAIRLRVEKNELKISSSNTETGESEDSLETSYDGDPIMIGFNSQYLLDFLRVVNSGDVRFEFKDSQSAGQLRPDEPPDSEYKYRYIIMPMRI
ncbi:MAG TPA: DNA polymerase III subunit beta [Candidatus Angelobacter sp.]|jgi:DNA polymerase-3 subunit beta|nr:DNA polymerase III subunit beta [Candidatus Angelobacter sp.]